MELFDLPDELLVAVAATLTALDLVRFCATCRRTAQLDVEIIWRALCAESWQLAPRFRLTAERNRWLDTHMQCSWRLRFRNCLAEMSRTEMLESDLRDLDWHFNFTRLAGGRGQHTKQRARFHAGHLYVMGYPPLPYSLHAPDPVPTPPSASAPADPPDPPDDPTVPTTSVGLGMARVRELLRSMLTNVPPVMGPPPRPPQLLLIANFPPHVVTRLDNAEWLMYNENVTITTDAEFNERDFNYDPNATDGEGAPGAGS